MSWINTSAKRTFFDIKCKALLRSDAFIQNAVTFFKLTSPKRAAIWYSCLLKTKRFVWRWRLYQITALLYSFFYPNSARHYAFILSFLWRFIFSSALVLLLRFPRVCIVFFMPLVSLFRALYFFFFNLVPLVSLICFFSAIAWTSPFPLFHCLQRSSLGFQCAPFAPSSLSLSLLSPLLLLSRNRCRRK